MTKECTAKCREGWDEQDDHCYLWSSETQSWREAEEFCVKEAAHLASVLSKSTNDYILEGIGKRDVEFLWVGGSYRGLEGGWKWIDCRFGDMSIIFLGLDLLSFFAQKAIKVSIFYFRDLWEFTNWDENQPSGTFEGHQQHCLSYNNYTGGAWNDATCGIPYKFLCSQKLCSGIP